MDAQGKTQKIRIDAFAFFKKAVSEIFESRLAEFGFGQVGISEYMPDCVITYQNETTGINVRYEWKSQVSINLIKLERTAGEVTEGRQYDLLLLMQIRRPAIDTNKFYGDDKEWTDDYIEERLREYASFLTEDARDVLTGDFTIFPELKKLSAKYRRETNKELFGTYTGISPRFTTRPTLEQVFAGAKDVDPELARLFGNKLNQDKTSSRIYEAYWDHEYSITEIAGFLKETEGSIERALDEYDDRG